MHSASPVTETAPQKVKGNGGKIGSPTGKHLTNSTSIYQVCAGDCDTCKYTAKCREGVNRAGVKGCTKDCFEIKCRELNKCPLQQPDKRVKEYCGL